MTQGTVKYSELVRDGNFLDSAFGEYVREWMSRNMPGFSLGLLDTDDPERWEVQAAMTHTVKDINVTVWVCPQCEERHAAPDAECCHDDDDEPVPLERTDIQGYAVFNEDTGDFVFSSTSYTSHEVWPTQDDEVDLDGEEVYLWDDEGDAEAAASWCDDAYEAYGDANRYGFPWANSYARMPESFISDGDLKEAGFVVATYTGGSGGRYDEQFRLCGIDGGGYDFTTCHFAKLVAIVTSRIGVPVETTQGRAIVDMDERHELVKLADAIRSGEAG